jgi:hypothetical protein
LCKKTGKYTYAPFIFSYILLLESFSGSQKASSISMLLASLNGSHSSSTYKQLIHCNSKPLSQSSWPSGRGAGPESKRSGVWGLIPVSKDVEYRSRPKQATDLGKYLPDTATDMAPPSGICGRCWCSYSRRGGCTYRSPPLSAPPDFPGSHHPLPPHPYKKNSLRSVNCKMKSVDLLKRPDYKHTPLPVSIFIVHGPISLVKGQGVYYSIQSRAPVRNQCVYCLLPLIQGPISLSRVDY